MLRQPQRRVLAVSVAPGFLFGDEEVGKTQVAGIMNMNTYGMKASEIYTVVMGVLAINFINGESCWVYLQSRSLRTVIPPAR